MAAARRVGLVFDDRYLTHNTGLDLFGEQTPYPYAEPVQHVSRPGLVGTAKTVRRTLLPQQEEAHVSHTTSAN